MSLQRVPELAGVPLHFRDLSHSYHGAQTDSRGEWINRP